MESDDGENGRISRLGQPGQTSRSDLLVRACDRTSWSDLPVGPPRQSSWSDLPVGPLNQTPWSDVLARPRGQVSRSDFPVRPLGRTSSSDLLVRPCGQTSRSDPTVVSLRPTSLPSISAYVNTIRRKRRMVRLGDCRGYPSVLREATHGHRCHDLRVYGFQEKIINPEALPRNQSLPVQSGG
jgi:hypothetical protein